MMWTARKIIKVGSIEYSDAKISNFVKRAYILASGCIFMLVMLIFMVLDAQETESRTIYNPLSWLIYIIVISIFFVGFYSTRKEKSEE